MTALAHGSGFLAVFVAGILFADAPVPHRREVEIFHKSLASLAEVVVFVALGLTVDLTELNEEWLWFDGLLLALLLVFVARPLVVGTLVLPVRLDAGERLFVTWSGLKGAVPILLATFPILEEVKRAPEIYGIVFVVVAFSVVFHGTTVPLAARMLGVPMRAARERSAA